MPLLDAPAAAFHLPEPVRRPWASRYVVFPVESAEADPMFRPCASGTPRAVADRKDGRIE